MKVMRITDGSESGGLEAGESIKPQPGSGELLIRVCAAGVTPTELLWYPTSHTQAGEKRSGAVPGHEFSGVIAGVGEGASGEIGQEVYGMNDWFADGATAEYCISRPSWIAAKPSRASHVEAASVPIGALTAWQGLRDRARVQAGERVLVHGGAGAVGIFAVQLARDLGAHVIATASARNLEFVTELGANEVIDYREERFEERVKDVDVVFDTVGGETLERSWSVLKAGGRLVTIAADVEGTNDARLKAAFFIVEANHGQLGEVAAMIDAGKLRTVVDAVAPFDEAPAAYAGKVARRHGRGKVVVEVAGSGCR